MRGSDPAGPVVDVGSQGFGSIGGLQCCPPLPLPPPVSVGFSGPPFNVSSPWFQLFVIVVWNFELYMVPLALLLPLAWNYVLIVSGKDTRQDVVSNPGAPSTRLEPGVKIYIRVVTLIQTCLQ